MSVSCAAQYWKKEFLDEVIDVTVQVMMELPVSFFEVPLPSPKHWRGKMKEIISAALAKIHDDHQPSSEQGTADGENESFKPNHDTDRSGIFFDESIGTLGFPEASVSGDSVVEEKIDSVANDAVNDARSCKTLEDDTPAGTNALCKSVEFEVIVEEEEVSEFEEEIFDQVFSTCPLCFKRYIEPSSLYKHIEAKHLEEVEKDRRKKVRCVECKKIFVRLRTYMKHLMSPTHTKRAKFVEAEIEEHDESGKEGSGVDTERGSEEPLTLARKCPYCANRFCDIQGLKEHLTVAHPDHQYFDPSKLTRRVECLDCGKQFASAWSMRRHQELHLDPKKKQKHDKAALWGKCEHCDFVAAEGSRYNLKHHMRKTHGTCLSKRAVEKKPKQQCDLCGAFVRTLSAHRKLHVGKVEKPYACNECGKRFALSHYLKIHMQTTHKQLKRYICGICGYMCYYLSKYNLHMKVHDGLKEFKCSICSKEFRQRYRLNQHIRIVHQGEKPFRCSVCDEAFTKLYHLATHRRQVHGLAFSSEMFADAVPAEDYRREWEKKLLEDILDVALSVIASIPDLRCKQILKLVKTQKEEFEKSLRALFCKLVEDAPDEVTDGLLLEEDFPGCTKNSDDFFSILEEEREGSIRTDAQGLEEKDLITRTCLECDSETFQDEPSFQAHLSIVHEGATVKDVKKSYHCSVCDVSFPSHHRVSKHCQSQKHQRLTAEAREPGYSESLAFLKQLGSRSSNEDQSEKPLSEKDDDAEEVTSPSALCVVQMPANAKCEKCDLKFDSFSALKQHNRRKHRGTAKGIMPVRVVMRCDLCSFTGSEREWKVHRRNLHGLVEEASKKIAKPGKQQCEECGECFVDVVAHKKLHKNRIDLPFHCEQCGRRFARSSYMKLHISTTHEQRKRYACAICGYMCYHLSKFNLHMRFHNDVREHKCKICGKSFRQRYQLTNHNKIIHEGKKPHSCDICQEGFTKAEYLRAHLKKVHEVVAPKVIRVRQPKAVLPDYNMDWKLPGVPTLSNEGLETVDECLINS
ncbi:unnamed protein product [Cyprideis torosa]|uniref:Uncharacterized protein n=1 Tax=Cyprideis torosa TaxID=163714 RepID=A0A7R8W5N7_9CRUS|nr:unnamed protein product [Cyprideis torosa]CAG0885422.1 unnamed protein product [Cyprideis torosa]